MWLIVRCFSVQFFYKNTLYKNTEAQITQKLRTMTRLDARTQNNFKGEKKLKSIETWHKWAMNEENAQTQKKLYNRRSMPSKSSAATYSVASSVNKMWYTRIWVLKFIIFLQTSHNHPEILFSGWYRYTSTHLAWLLSL